MIIYDEKQHIFQLNTKSTSYMIGITPEGYLGHIYYGERLQHIDGGYLLRTEEYPYTPERNKRRKMRIFGKLSDGTAIRRHWGFSGKLLGYSR